MTHNQTDQAFLETYNPDAFPHPSVTIDVVLVSVVDRSLKVRLVQREAAPQQGKWSLPGGFVALDEELDQAASRILKAKAGLTHVFLEQLYTFGNVDRDPRTRVITVAYYALVNAARLGNLPLGTLQVPWQGEAGGPVIVKDSNGAILELAFDHAEIIGMAVKRIRGKLNYSPIDFQLLPEQFTLRELQVVHETILNHPVNKDSFRRRLLATGALKATGQYEQNTRYRPAELYEFIEGSAI